jgi:hypothetical protein
VRPADAASTAKGFRIGVYALRGEKGGVANQHAMAGHAGVFNGTCRVLHRWFAQSQLGPVDNYVIR